MKFNKIYMLGCLIFAGQLTHALAIDPEKTLSKSTIEAIKNFAACQVFLCRTDVCQSIKPRSQKKLGLDVPFISIREYMTQYVQGIPYVPKRALCVRSELGVHYLWQNEMGIICAPNPQDFENLPEWKSRILVATERNSALANLMMKCLLLIDEEGKPSIKKAKSL